MAGLYKAADCYVGISKEGFGLGFAEAMAAGCACIGPEVGGTRQFMNEENSFLVKYLGDEPIAPEMVAMNPIFEGLTWAKHSWESLSETMRYVVENKDKRIEVAKKGKEFIGKTLTFNAIGGRINALVSGDISS
jgi:glycosyltransferase involved in cell wall biosynthesis